MRSIEEILEDFEAVDDWEERYTYLIEMGKKLPSFPEEGRIEGNRIQGCQSRVWLVAGGSGEGFQFLADSDSLIVKGLIAVLMSLYCGKTEEEVLRIDEQEVFQQLGLETHLSAGRKNGLRSLVLGLKRLAQHVVCARAREEESTQSADQELSTSRASVA